MKRLTLTTILMCAACIAQAQLRVTANGNVSLQSTETPLSVLSIGSEGVDDYFLSTKGAKQGMISIVNGGQNKSFDNWQVITGGKIFVGKNVTPLQESGKVIVKKNAHLTFKSKYETILDNGFECEKGACLTIE